jgi:ferrous iron transport protein B
MQVPGIMATRILEGRREKFIASALVAMAVPCMSQIAMIIGLVGERGGQYLAIVFGTLFSLIIIKGLILNKFLKGQAPRYWWRYRLTGCRISRRLPERSGYAFWAT